MRCAKLIILIISLVSFTTFAFAESNYTITRSTAYNVNEWSICKRVVNNANNDIFIPTKTSAEWQSFINNLPSSVTLTYCTPSSPSSLKVTRQGTQALLTWSAPSTDWGSTITNYNIYRGTLPGSETLYATISNVNSYTDPSVSSSSNYYYKVAAVNGGGEGTLSSEAVLSSCSPNVITSCGSCSVSCGGGTQTCTNQCGGALTQNCNTQCCPVNGVWTDWSGWSDTSGCSASCGGGTKTQQRTRTCTNPSPSCGGTACAGSSTDSQTVSCNTQSCCNPNIMTSCGACSTTCGSGTKTCTNQCGGTVTQGCYDGSSLGQTSSCSGWGGCSGSCGSGTQSRTCYYTCGGSYSQSQSCVAGSSGDCGCGKGCCCPNGMWWDGSAVCTNGGASWYCNDAAGGYNSNKACGGGPLVCHVCSCNW